MAKDKTDLNFYCAKCGTQVDKGAKVCHACNSLLASIKCPNCGFVGTEKNFTNGCPECQFQSSSLTKLRNDAIRLEQQQKAAGNRRGSSRGHSSNKKPKVELNIPPWVYWLLLGSLGITAIAFILIVKNLLSS